MDLLNSFLAEVEDEKGAQLYCARCTLCNFWCDKINIKPGGDP